VAGEESAEHAQSLTFPADELFAEFLSCSQLSEWFPYKHNMQVLNCHLGLDIRYPSPLRCSALALFFASFRAADLSVDPSMLGLRTLFNSVSGSYTVEFADVKKNESLHTKYEGLSPAFYLPDIAAHSTACARTE
jgi:hypothetical protein